MAADIGDVFHGEVPSMAAWMPDAVPTVIALAGAIEAAATIAEAAVRERRILRIKTLLGLL
jgi:hypothetical protein